MNLKQRVDNAKVLALMYPFDLFIFKSKNHLIKDQIFCETYMS